MTKLMWDEKQIPKGCTCSQIANVSGYLLVIADDCPVHGKYLKTWKEGMCTIINRSTTEAML